MRKGLFIILLSALFSSSSHATTWVIQAVDNDFRPNFINLQFGDTVKWEWINGVHTTSSNGIPLYAPPWNALLDSAHTSFTYVIQAVGTYNYISVLNVPLMSGVFTTPVTGIEDVNAVFGDVKAWWSAAGEKTMIQYSLKEDAKVDIELLNLNGQVLQSLSQNNFASTFIHEEIPSAGLPAGYYLIALFAGNVVVSRKIFIE